MNSEAKVRRRRMARELRRRLAWRYWEVSDPQHSLFDYRFVLHRELKKRKRLSPKYSLRDFAKDLGLSPSHLCEVLQLKKGLSHRSANRVGGRLLLFPRQHRQFLFLARARSGRSRVERRNAMTILLRPRQQEAQRELEKVCFDALDWLAQVRRLIFGSPVWDQRVVRARLSSVAIEIGPPFPN